MERSRATRLVSLAIAIAGIALFVLFNGQMPRDQTVHIVLGDAAPLVTEVRVRYGERAKSGPPGPTSEWLREAAFPYPRGAAPRIVSHVPRLADGDYLVEIDVLGPEKPATIERRVAFAGGTVSLDVSQAIPK